MNARFTTCVLVLVASAACNTRVSTSPSPIPPPITLPPVIESNTVSGLVTSAGSIPVAGARVFLLDESGAAVPDVFAVTDATGHYRIERLSKSPFLGTLVGASAITFFADHAWVSLLPDTRLDFTLDALTFIVLGDTIRARISDTMCAGLGYGGGSGAPCQRFALTVPRSGTLTVTLTAANFAFDFDVARPDGTFAVYRALTASPARVDLLVEAGLTYQLRVVRVGGGSEFELTTALR